MSINACFKIQFIYHCTTEIVEENESSDMILYGSSSFSINTTNHDKSRAERNRNDLKTTALLLPHVYY